MPAPSLWALAPLFPASSGFHLWSPNVRHKAGQVPAGQAEPSSTLPLKGRSCVCTAQGSFSYEIRVPLVPTPQSQTSRGSSSGADCTLPSRRPTRPACPLLGLVCCRPPGLSSWSPPATGGHLSIPLLPQAPRLWRQLRRLLPGHIQSPTTRYHPYSPHSFTHSYLGVEFNLTACTHSCG